MVASCTTETPTATYGAAVTMGAVDPADPATVALVGAPIACGELPRTLCTGTLIAPRVVLTAAHCVTALPAADLLVLFGDDVASGSSTLIAVDRVIVHPDYAAPANDVGVVILAQPAPAIAPIPLRTTALSAADEGAQVRIAGFGADELGGLGIKRTGTASLAAINARDFVIGAAPAMSCEGDSGGPVFLTHDMIEEVVGITAYGDAQCKISGTNMRVDAYATFIVPTLTAVSTQRPELDPSADFCAAACEGDADCPLGMGCVPSPAGGMGCGLRGLAPGRLGATCGAGGECDGGMCLSVGTGCQCYAPCRAPGGDEGGCTVAGGNAIPLLILACGLMLRSTRRSAMRRS